MSAELPSQADQEREVQNNNEQKEEIEKQITRIEDAESSGSDRIASIEEQLNALKEGLEDKLEEISKSDAVASIEEQKEEELQKTTLEQAKPQEIPEIKEPLVNRVVGSIPILGEVNDLFRARKLHSRIKKLQGSTAEITANGSVNNVAIQAEQLADTIAYSEQVLGTSVIIPMLENGLNKDAIRSFQSELLTESEDVLKEVKA